MVSIRKRLHLESQRVEGGIPGKQTVAILSDFPVPVDILLLWQKVKKGKLSLRLYMDWAVKKFDPATTVKIWLRLSGRHINGSAKVGESRRDVLPIKLKFFAQAK